MAHVFLEMSMTLDGFTAGHGASIDHPLGIDGECVHEWIRNSVFHGAVPSDDARAAMFESTGAFVIGRRTFDVGEGPWGDDPVFQGRPCFVVTSRERDPYERGGSRYEFVTGGVGAAVERASTAASAASVCIMGGADVARQALSANLVDEVRLHLAPFLLGGGTRLFPDASEHRIDLGPTSVEQGALATHLRYRVLRTAA